jgi:hypothetical protein
LGRSVDIKWYGKLEGLLDLAAHDQLPDFYLVMTGPRSTALTSRGGVRPWCIESVFLFDTTSLLEQLRERGVRIGTATSVATSYWQAAELYPTARCSVILLTGEQRRALALFAGDPEI